MTGSLWDIDDNQINEVRELINSNNKYLSDPILGMELVAKILPKGRTKNDDYKSALRLRSIFSKKIWSKLHFVDKSIIPDETINDLLSQLNEYKKVKLLLGKSVIGIGGKFSAGKSGFINSILGFYNELVLPEDQNPTTSIPTYITYDKTQNISVFCDNEVVAIDIDEMKAITHEFYDKYKIGFSRFSKNLIISTPNFLDKQMNEFVFLDTPGYNKPIEDSLANLSDRNISIEQLKIVDYIIWLIDMDNGTIQADDIDFLRKIDNQNPILIVFNKADKHPEGKIREILDSAIETLKKSGINYYDVIAYSSKENKEYTTNNSIGKFMQLVASNQNKKINLDTKVDSLIKTMNEFLLNKINCLKKQRKDLSHAIYATDQIIDISCLAYAYGKVCSEIKEMEDEKRTFFSIVAEINRQLEILDLNNRCQYIKNMLSTK